MAFAFLSSDAVLVLTEIYCDFAKKKYVLKDEHRLLSNIPC